MLPALKCDTRLDALSSKSVSGLIFFRVSFDKRGTGHYLTICNVVTLLLVQIFQNNGRLSRQVLIVDDKRTASKIATVFGNINLTFNEQFNWKIGANYKYT